ncbi:MAG: Crp/Fnr family transcriptional regulator [Bacteroidota bacterium]
MTGSRLSDALIEYLSSFHPLTEEERKDIVSFFHPRRLAEGDFLFKGNKVCKELFFIVSGVVRIISTNHKGEEVTYFFIGAGQICTILDSFLNKTVTDNAIQVSSEAEVLVINIDGFNALCNKLPFFSGIIDRINQSRLLEKVKLKNAYSGLDATERYLQFLKLQADVAYQVPLNHIATYLNVTPQSLSRIRKAIR